MSLTVVPSAQPSTCRLNRPDPPPWFHCQTAGVYPPFRQHDLKTAARGPEGFHPQFPVPATLRYPLHHLHDHSHIHFSCSWTWTDLKSPGVRAILLFQIYFQNNVLFTLRKSLRLCERLRGQCAVAEAEPGSIFSASVPQRDPASQPAPRPGEISV